MPPTVPSARPRAGEALNQRRSWLASSAHTLSETQPDHEGDQPEQQHLQAPVAAVAVDELRQHAAKIT